MGSLRRIQFIQIFCAFLFFGCIDGEDPREDQSADQSSKSSQASGGKSAESLELPPSDEGSTLTHSDILAVTQAGDLVVIDPKTSEQILVLESGSITSIVTHSTAAGLYQAVMLEEAIGEDMRYRFLILDRDLRVLAAHIAPDELRLCLEQSPSLFPMAKDSNRFLVRCGQNPVGRTHAVILGEQLDMIRLPEGHNYLGKPVDGQDFRLPLLHLEDGAMIMSVIDVTSGQIQETGRHPLDLTSFPVGELPQGDDGIIYAAEKHRKAGQTWQATLRGFDAFEGALVFTQTIEVELDLNGRTHTQIEILNNHIALKTVDGAAVVNLATQDVASEGDPNWPMTRVSSDARDVLMSFGNRIERRSLLTNQTDSMTLSDYDEWDLDSSACDGYVDGMQLAPGGESALFSASGSWHGCVTGELYEYGQEPSIIGYAIVVRIHDFEPVIVLKNFKNFAPTYDPSGTRLSYVEQVDECPSLKVVNLIDESQHTVSEGLCLKPQSVRWINWSNPM